MTWTAIVPLKGGPARKTRLAERLSATERLALSDGMAGHVLAVLHDAGLRPCVLSPAAWGAARWEPDRGAGRADLPSSQGAMLFGRAQRVTGSAKHRSRGAADRDADEDRPIA